MRMPSATIQASSPSLSSASRNRKQLRNQLVVVDDPPLELPLRWRDPPLEYPPLELPLRWRDPPPLQCQIRDPEPPSSAIASTADDSASASSHNLDSSHDKKDDSDSFQSDSSPDTSPPSLLLPVRSGDPKPTLASTQQLQHDLSLPHPQYSACDSLPDETTADVTSPSPLAPNLVIPASSFCFPNKTVQPTPLQRDRKVVVEPEEATAAATPHDHCRAPLSSRNPMPYSALEAMEKPFCEVGDEKNPPLYSSPGPGSECSEGHLDNDERRAANTHSRSSCNSENSLATAHECKVCNDTEEEKNCLAASELRLAEDWLKKVFRTLNHYVDSGTIVVKWEISYELRLLKLKEKFVMSGCEDYASGGIGVYSITGVQILNLKSIDKVNPMPCSQTARRNVADDFRTRIPTFSFPPHHHIFPASLKVIQPDHEFSVYVGISTDIQFGRLLLVMDKNFCADGADKLLELAGNIRRVDATNNMRDLRIYLYFSEPVLNSSVQVLNVLRASSGFLLPTNGSTLGNQRLEYKVIGVSRMDEVTINCATSSILIRQGTPISASNPFMFLYDVPSPVVRLGTTAYMRTRECNIPIAIKFVNPVLGFNSSTLLISGGHFVSFREVSKSICTGIIQVDDNIVSIEVPENSTDDIAGNKNLASNHLLVRQYSIPILSSMVSAIATVTFAATAMAAAFLTVTTASLLSSGVFSRPTTCLEPTKNLVRIACHIQVFTLSKWLTAVMPNEYYEFARGIEWSIPYSNLPWERKCMDSFLKDSSFLVVTYSELSEANGLNSFEPMTVVNEESKSNTVLFRNCSLLKTAATNIENKVFDPGGLLSSSRQRASTESRSFDARGV